MSRRSWPGSCGGARAWRQSGSAAWQKRQVVSSGDPALNSCQLARHSTCTWRGQRHSCPSAPPSLLARQIQHVGGSSQPSPSRSPSPGASPRIARIEEWSPSPGAPSPPTARSEADMESLISVKAGV
jgi:hypothetical protein